MAKKSSTKPGSPVRTNLLGNSALWPVTFETNSTGTPDNVEPATGVTLARASAGTYTITFDAHSKPLVVHHGIVTVREQGLLNGKLLSYSSSTGKVTLEVRSGATSTALDTNNKTVDVLLFCDWGRLQSL